MLIERSFLTCQPPVSVAPFPWQAPQHHVAEAPQTCTLGPWAPVLELLYLRLRSTKEGFFAWLKKTSGMGNLTRSNGHLCVQLETNASSDNRFLVCHIKGPTFVEHCQCVHHDIHRSKQINPHQARIVRSQDSPKLTKLEQLLLFAPKGCSDW